MNQIQPVVVRTFDTDEDRLRAFFSATGISAPRLTAGKAEFFRGFNGWLWNYSAPSAPNELLSIPPDPSLAIAFPYPFEELASAIALCSGTYPDAATVAALLESFGLPNALATRPVGVLSGGERLLLALAKATALHPVTAKLAICSPTHWLNSNEAPPQTDERVRFSLRSELEEAQQAPRENGCRSTSPVHQRQTLAAWRSGASPPLIPTQKTKDILGCRRAQGTGP